MLPLLQCESYKIVFVCLFVSYSQNQLHKEWEMKRGGWKNGAERKRSVCVSFGEWERVSVWVYVKESEMAFYKMISNKACRVCVCHKSHVVCSHTHTHTHTHTRVEIVDKYEYKNKKQTPENIFF